MSYQNNNPALNSLFAMPTAYQLQGASGFGPPPGVEFGPRGFAIPPSAVNHLGAVQPLLIPYGMHGAMQLHDGLRPYGHLGGMPLSNEHLAFDKDAAALAEGLDRLSLNPLAKEYVPSRRGGYIGRGGGYPVFPGRQTAMYNSGRGRSPYGPPEQQQAPPQQQQQQQPRGGRGRESGTARGGRDKKQGQRKRRTQKGLEENVKRTVYISYIDQQVTEEQLASFFQDCGKVIDCRICGDPNSAMRFAFIEFTEVESAQKAVHKTGSVLGGSSLRVLPSKTAIVPVNKELMPKTGEELERCSRTVYAANIDKKVDKNSVKSFFEQFCGPVAKIRLLGDFAHSTRIAFVEFERAESAIAALNCTGALLGSLPIRVSPSKTPVRAENEKQPMPDSP